MTLAVAVASADGLVVAADSRMTFRMPVEPPVPTRVLSDYSHKLFRIGDVAVATFGQSFVLERNIAGHMGEFARTLPALDAGTVLAPANFVAVQLCQFFGSRLEQQLAAEDAQFAAEGEDREARRIGLAAKLVEPERQPLGFLVAGYEQGAGLVYEVTLPAGTVQQVAAAATGGAVWRGQTDVVSRLLKGIDRSLLTTVVGDGELSDHLHALEPHFDQMEYIVPLSLLNLQDAIDFAVLAIRTTVDVHRLTHGTKAFPGSWPGVGGPIGIAVISPADGFVWVQRTQLQGERSFRSGID